MLANYVSLGFNPSDFWGLTLRLYLAQTRGALQTIEREQNGRAWTAWTTAALTRCKTMPAFDKFIKKRSRRQGPEELQAMFDALAASWAKGK